MGGRTVLIRAGTVTINIGTRRVVIVCAIGVEIEVTPIHKREPYY
jgi:hypothetical protein